jgi:hypothetical protein
MTISGNYFKYDNKSSMPYGLRFMNIKTSDNDTLVNGEYEHITIQLPHSDKFVNVGRKPKEQYQFEAEFITEKLITPNMHREITRWLFDRVTNHKLEIMSDDGEYEDVYYNCIIQKPTKFIGGNSFGAGIHGYKCTVVCNSTSAWEREKTNSYSFTSTPSTFNFINNSDNEDYMLPKIVITIGTTGGDISIVKADNPNTNDNTIQLTSTVANEIITIDEYGQI